MPAPAPLVPTEVLQIPTEATQDRAENLLVSVMAHAGRWGKAAGPVAVVGALRPLRQMLCLPACHCACLHLQYACLLPYQYLCQLYHVLYSVILSLCQSKFFLCLPVTMPSCNYASLSLSHAFSLLIVFVCLQIALYFSLSVCLFLYLTGPTVGTVPVLPLQ